MLIVNQKIYNIVIQYVNKKEIFDGIEYLNNDML